MRRSMAELAASLQSDARDNSPLELRSPTHRSAATSLEENAGVNINSSLDYANALPNASVPLSISSEPADQPREQQVESEMLPQGQQLLMTAEAAQEFRAKAFELMTADSGKFNRVPLFFLGWVVTQVSYPPAFQVRSTRSEFWKSSRDCKGA
jgi:hypothetical protein